MQKIVYCFKRKEKGENILSKNKEKFKILLDQINVTEDVKNHPLIQTGEIVQVLVHKNQKNGTLP
mgnify:FL=1